MSILAATKATGKFAGKAGLGIIRKIKLIFIIFVFAIMLINALMISLEAKDITPGVEYIGFKLLLSSNNLAIASAEIVERGGLYNGEDGVVNGSWELLKSIYYLFEALFIIYMWIKLFAWIALHIFLVDSSKNAAAYNIAVFLIYFPIQMITVLAFTNDSMLKPFLAFYYFALAMMQIMTPMSNIAEDFANSAIINMTIS